MNKQRIIVTGANGFLGSCVVEALFIAGSYEIIPTSRRLHAGGRVARFGCRLHPADLTQRGSVDELVDGAGSIVHCAYGGDSDQEQATRMLLEAASAASIRTFIHISTTEVYAVQEGALDEESPIQLKGQNYAAIKGRIDALVQSHASCFENLVILRPAIIYGPLSESFTIGPIRRILAGWSPPIAELQGTGNFVHVADVCHIIQQILSNPRPGKRIYNVVGPDVLTWAEYYQRLEKALGLSIPGKETRPREKIELGMVRRITDVLPTPMRRRLVSLVTLSPLGGRMVARWRHLHGVEPISAEMVLFARKVQYSTVRLKEDGFTPNVAIDDGIRQSVTWARQIGLA